MNVDKWKNQQNHNKFCVLYLFLHNILKNKQKFVVDNQAKFVNKTLYICELTASFVHRLRLIVFFYRFIIIHYNKKNSRRLSFYKVQRIEVECKREDVSHSNAYHKHCEKDEKIAFYMSFVSVFEEYEKAKSRVHT